MKTDIEIARETKLLPIRKIAEKLGLPEDDYDCYGKYKAKIKITPENRSSHLILVTAMNPTPFGEGKTTVSIGLADALSLLGKKTCLALREPSLGPVFGIKGGACGGGYAQIAPMEDINLHFNGDFHAITYANDLLSALIDNHIAQGNELNIDKVVWKRCIDLNDRALRNVEVGLGGEKNGVPREDGFTITAASEVMAILCLAADLKDLKRRLGNILIGYDKSGKELFAKDLGAEESMTILLKDAIYPNLVQTLEGTPAIVHGGPFANIAHGCNTVTATSVAMATADYVVTEAGFGAELGAEKFFDIKCRKAKLSPEATVLVITLRSIKHNAYVPSDKIASPNNDAIIKGFGNVKRHISNLKTVFNQNVVVALNRFPTDTDEEIALVKDLCEKESVAFAVSEGFLKGGKGNLSLAEAVLGSLKKTDLTLTYSDEITVKEKIEAVAKRVYGAKGVAYSEKAEKVLSSLNDVYSRFPVCIAKTQYSFSGNPALLGAPEDFYLDVQDVLIRSGAEFLVIQCGSILLMPGLSKVPCALKMTISDDGTINGLM